jgi:thiamine biosynthesis protein ThiS
MNIILNNVHEEAQDGHTIKQLLDHKKIHSKYIAVEINRKIIPKSNYHKHKIHEGDKIEIITAIGGG